MERVSKREDRDYWLIDFIRENSVFDADKISKMLSKCRDYENIEEEGKLVRLPCKVGDTVYQLMINMDKSDVKTKKITYEVYEATVTKYIMDSFYLMFCTKTKVGNYQNELTINAFGETVFLTREEAEEKISQL